MVVKLSKDDIEAISRVVESEVGGTPLADRQEHIKNVVDTILNRGAINYSDYGGIQGQLNAKNQFSAVSGNKNSVGSWNRLPAASKMVADAVKARVGEVFASGKTQPFTSFANPDYSSPANRRDWVDPMARDPSSVTVGDPKSGVYHVYGKSKYDPAAPDSVNLALGRNALYPGMAADTIDRNLAADQQAMGPQYTKPTDPGFFSLGGFLPAKPADMTLQDPAPKAYDPLSSISPPSIDVARSLMSGLTPPASVPTPALVQADMSGGFGLGLGATAAGRAQAPPHIADPTAKPSWSAPTADPLSSMYGLGTLAQTLHAPWSVEGQAQPPAVTRAPVAPPSPSLQGAAALGAGLGGQAGFSRKFTDPFSNPQPLQAEAGAYSPPSLPGWTVHDTPPGQFSLPGRQPAMGAFTQASTATPQAPPSSGWVARGIPSFDQSAPTAPRSTAQATMQARPGLGIGASATGNLSFAKAPPVTRSIAAPPAAPHVYTKPESALSPAAMPSWASLATAAATSAVPGLGMLAAMPATAALAQKALAALPGLPQQAPTVPPTAAVAPPITQPVVTPRPPKPVPVSLPAPRPRPTLSPDPSLSGWGTMAAANNPFQAAGLSLLGQSALGKPMYGGGYINGVQQVFSGNRPSNAFGGLGYGNPFSGLAGLFSGGVQRAQAVPSQVGSFLGGLFGGGGPGNAGGGGGFGGGFGGGTFGGGGYGGGPGSPGHRDSSH